MAAEYEAKLFKTKTKLSPFFIENLTTFGLIKVFIVYLCRTVCIANNSQ